MSKVLTAGTFDLLHVGHQELFRACRLIAGTDGEVVVSVNPDEFVRTFKSAPIQTFDERCMMVESSRYVDRVVRTPGPNLTSLLASETPDFLVIGSDWALPRADGRTYHDQIGVSREQLLDIGVALLYLDRATSYSSTELKERVRGNA